MFKECSAAKKTSDPAPGKGKGKVKAVDKKVNVLETDTAAVGYGPVFRFSSVDEEGDAQMLD